MTSFFIGHMNDVYANGVTITESSGHDGNNIAQNLFLGSRNQTFATTVTDHYAQVELVSTLEVEYFFCCRADLLRDKVTQKLVLLGDDGGYTDILGTNTNMFAKTYSGPRLEDIMFTSTFNSDVTTGTTTASDFRVQFGSPLGAATRYELSNAFWGTFLDLGRDPVYPFSFTRLISQRYLRYPPLALQLSWEGITDAKRNAFLSSVARYRDFQTFVLYDSQDLFMLDYKTLHCRLADYSVTAVREDVNTITATFIEVV